MDKNAIKKYAVWARRELISRVSQRAAYYGITEDWNGDTAAEIIMGRVLSDEEKSQRQALAARPQVEASTLAEEYPGDFARIIGLHTYSQSPHRNYDIRLTGNWVERGGFRFEDFVLTRRKEENDGND